MAAADEELLRLVCAVKTHHLRSNDGNDDDDDVLGQDYADAFDEDAILLCLSAIQAAAAADEWRASEHLTALTAEMMDWDMSPMDVTRKTKSELQIARWAFLTRAIDTEIVVTKHGDGVMANGIEGFRNKLVARMMSDRFAALDVQYAIVQCLIVGVQCNLITIADDVLELLKQFYVTLSRVAVRELLVQTLMEMLKTKDDVKQAIHAGILLAMLQVALSESRSVQARGLDPGDEDDAQELLTLARLMHNAVKLLRHVARLVCLQVADSPTSAPLTYDHSQGVGQLCAAVVQLLLSRVSIVFEAAIRLLQMLVESPTALAHLPMIPDLRGALDKAMTLATKPEAKPTVQDPYVRSLCEQLHALLIPQIDDYEKRHGSLVGLFTSTTTTTTTSCGSTSSSLDQEVESLSAENALALAQNRKATGNSFYQRGNFATARLFYRRAIAIVRAAEFQHDQKLMALSIQDKRARCTVGASVQVVAGVPSGRLRSAMVSDVEENDMIEVLYDANEEDHEEEMVPLTRIRLRMDTQLLEQFKTVAVDCAMNMGKSLTMLFDYESAVECFTHVLEIQPQYIAALYHRGVACLVLHDLQRAQQDLWQANALCGKWKTRGVAVEAKKKAMLHKQIVAAYKKLQTLHASKKKMDKKLVKQMLSYISSLPGLQDEDGDQT